MSEQSFNEGSSFGQRKFYELPEKPDEKTIDSVQKSFHVPSSTNNKDASGSTLFEYIRDNIVGVDKVFSAPFGLRKVVYCDYTASGRSLKFLEEYILEQVLPEYGNTHTTSSVTSLQTTLFRHEARDIVRNSVGASEHDSVIFVGSGCTAAVHKLIQALSLTTAPIVFVGPHDHHSTLLPWREIGSVVIRIRETPAGQVDLQHLLAELKMRVGEPRQLIGCFSAASNVTGTIAPVNDITIMLHKHGALAIWDYATAAPYMDINMNPLCGSADQPYVYKDAVFISTHKFVGGVQTPGVLVAKKKLFQNSVPSGCGGGAVFFVRREAHRYLQEVEMREEGGTPAIVEAIRAGLVFQLKDAVTCDAIMQREMELVTLANRCWKDVTQLVLLGGSTVARLPIFSFLVRHTDTGLFLHHNYVATLLNDVFGIQSRGGCACAGPYAQDILGIDEELALRIEKLLVEDSRLDRTHLRRYREYSEKEILRPGFVRIGLPYFLLSEDIEFILEAVSMVAKHGWKLLPQYTFNPETGEWRHKNHQVFQDRKWLGYVSYKSGEMSVRPPPCPAKGPLPDSHKDCLEKATTIFNQASSVRVQVGDQRLMFDDESSALRWFLLPSEAYACLQDPKTAAKLYKKPPFTPPTYPRTIPQNESVIDSDNSHVKHMILPGITLPIPSNKHDMSSTYDGTTNTCKPDDILADKPTSATNSDVSHLGNGIGADRSNYRHGLKSELSEGYLPTDDDVKPCCLDDDCNCDINCDNVNVSSIPCDNKLVSCTDEQSGISLHSDIVDSVDTTNYNGHHNAESEQPHPPKMQKLSEHLKNNNSINDSESIDDLHVKDIVSVTPPAESTTCIDGSCFIRRTENAEPTPECPVQSKWHCPPKTIWKPTVTALEEFNMIQNGDRVLICLSGGKDSLSLLHLIHQYQFYARKKGIEFEMGAVTVDPMTTAYDPSPLKGYLSQLKVPYFYEEQAILDAAATVDPASICSFCSRMKRGRIYHAARREKYNVLAMGQHLDDLAESFLMSTFHNGALRTMKANYTNKEKDLRIIRPFVYVREKDLRKFAEDRNLPVIPENCPACFEAPKERHRMKQLLASQEVLFPRLFHSLASSIRPLMAISSVGVNIASILAGAGDRAENVDDEDDV